MAETAMEYRLWVMRHWSQDGWSLPREEVATTKKGQAALAWLRKKGFLEEDPLYLGMHRRTDAGVDYLAMAGGDVQGSGW